MKKLITFYLLFTGLAWSQQQGQYGRYTNSMKSCQDLGSQIETSSTKEMRDGIEYICLENYKCYNTDPVGNVTVNYTPPRVCKKASELFVTNQNDQCVGGNCHITQTLPGGGITYDQNGQIVINSGTITTAGGIPKRCSRLCSKAGDYQFYLQARSSKKVIKSRHTRKLEKYSNKCQQCLFGNRSASCAGSATSTTVGQCFGGQTNVRVVQGNPTRIVYVDRGGGDDFRCSHINDSTCLPTQERRTINSEIDSYYDDDCPECGMKSKAEMRHERKMQQRDLRQERRLARMENKADRKANRGGGGGAGLGIALNGLFQGAGQALSGHFLGRGIAKAAEHCATAYDSYTGSINTQNEFIFDENGTRIGNGQPTLSYKDPRSPTCNGQGLNAFSGFSNILGGGIGGGNWGGAGGGNWGGVGGGNWGGAGGGNWGRPPQGNWGGGIGPINGNFGFNFGGGGINNGGYGAFNRAYQGKNGFFNQGGNPYGGGGIYGGINGGAQGGWPAHANGFPGAQGSGAWGGQGGAYGYGANANSIYNAGNMAPAQDAWNYQNRAFGGGGYGFPPY